MNRSPIEKKCVFGSLLCLITFFSFSQEIGIRGGFNAATTGGDSENIGWKPDYHIGVYYADEFSGGIRYFLSTTYSRQGGQVDRDLVDDWKMHHNYINIASLLGFEFTERWVVLAGPKLGIKLNGRADYPGFLDGNISESLSALNLSAATELHHEVSDNLSIYLGYSHGLTSNVAANNPVPGRFPDRFFQLGLRGSLIQLQ